MMLQLYVKKLFRFLGNVTKPLKYFNILQRTSMHIDVDHLFSKTSFIVFAEGTHDNYLKVLILVKKSNELTLNLA